MAVVSLLAGLWELRSEKFGEEEEEGILVPLEGVLVLEEEAEVSLLLVLVGIDFLRRQS